MRRTTPKPYPPGRRALPSLCIFSLRKILDGFEEVCKIRWIEEVLARRLAIQFPPLAL